MQHVQKVINNWMYLTPLEHPRRNELLLINAAHVLVAFVYIFGILLPPRLLKYYLVLLAAVTLNWWLTGTCWMTDLALRVRNGHTKNENMRFIPFLTKWDYRGLLLLIAVAIVGVTEPSLSPYSILNRVFTFIIK